jgi:branched-subunit amino acid transport protein
MEDDTIYTAHFVTLAYLRRQMELSYAVSQQLDYTPPVRYAALETPHILVDEINRDVIEDTIDNLIALDIFEGLFTQVTESVVEDDTNAPRTTTRNGARATQEVAAVVLSDVLVVRDDD